MIVNLTILVFKKTPHVDFNDKNLDRVRFVKINYLTAVSQHITPKQCVDAAIDELTLVRNNQNIDFKIFNLSIINSITLKTHSISDNSFITKAFVDQFHINNERSRRHLGIDFYNEASDLVENNPNNILNDSKLMNSDSISFNRDPKSNNELTNKEPVDYSIGGGNILKCNQTLEICLKVSFGNDIYNLTKYDKIQITDTTILKDPKTCSYLLQNWNKKHNDKNNKGKIQNFIKSTKTNSATCYSGAEV